MALMSPLHESVVAGRRGEHTRKDLAPSSSLSTFDYG